MNAGAPGDTHSHERVRIGGEIGAIGITDHGRKRVGEMVDLERPELGQLGNAGVELGAVGSLEAVSEPHALVPVEVVEVSQSAVAEPGLVDDDPHGDGRLIERKGSSGEGVGRSIPAEEHGRHVRREEKTK